MDGRGVVDLKQDRPWEIEPHLVRHVREVKEFVECHGGREDLCCRRRYVGMQLCHLGMACRLVESTIRLAEGVATQDGAGVGAIKNIANPFEQVVQTATFPFQGFLKPQRRFDYKL